MFALGILIGIYSYTIFFLGIAGLLYKPLIILVSVTYLSLSVFYLRKEIREVYNFLSAKNAISDRFVKLLLILITAISLVSLIGVFAPELSFDALWYHLTLPKIFLLQHHISHLKGGLFYYSDMPKLGEMIYIGALSFSNEILARLIHFSLGAFSLLALFKLSRKFLDLKLSLISVLIFASNLVFSWEAQTAYIDLFRTFFETMALWGLVNFYETKEKKWLMESSVMVGLGISSKILDAGSLLIFICLLIFIMVRQKSLDIKDIIRFCALSLFVVSPWLVFSLINTGNPLYPLFSAYYPNNFSPTIFSPIYALKSLYGLFLHSPDPINPIYIISLPIIVVTYKKFSRGANIVLIYSGISLVIWYFTPQTGGGRFILPYLPAYSILVAYIISLRKDWSKFLLGLVIIISVSSIGYRALANAKYIPVVLGFQGKNEFLTKHLNFNFGDFYDTDGFFANNIKSSDKVLLMGFHNLYYVDFPFLDSSYAKEGDSFNYIATQDTDLPQKYSFWHLIYQNPVTHVKLYSLGGSNWYY